MEPKPKVEKEEEEIKKEEEVKPHFVLEVQDSIVTSLSDFKTGELNNG
jgi:hypothetical protein